MGFASWLGSVFGMQGIFVSGDAGSIWWGLSKSVDKYFAENGTWLLGTKA